MITKNRKYLLHLKRVASSALQTALYLAILISLFPRSSRVVYAQGSSPRDAGLNEQAQAAKYGGNSAASGGRPGIAQATTQPSNQPAIPTATEESPSSIEVSTPAADGSIIHIVQPGEFIISIGQAYKIPLIDIFSLNNLTDQSVIFPGQKLVIKRADRTPEQPPTETTIATTPPPPTPTPTRRPTRTPLQTGSEVSETALETARSPGETATAVSQTPEPAVKQDNPLDLMLMLIGGLFAFGAAMILFGAVVRHRS